MVCSRPRQPLWGFRATATPEAEEGPREGPSEGSVDTTYPRLSAARATPFGGPAMVVGSIAEPRLTISTPSVARDRHPRRGLDVTGVSRRLNHPLPGGTTVRAEPEILQEFSHSRGLSDPLPTTG
ncbi:hypothetical protein GCM10023176_00150 [Micromonospora coerulea]|uniref:Uncharacterized protein n=1 Tax=Micromonospora coerulea TaxID=47856 RepID=A0ABP8S6D1_9ACTN